MACSPYAANLEKRELEILNARYAEQNVPIGLHDDYFFNGTEFRKNIVLWCAVCGVTNMPDEVMFQYTLNTIRSEYEDLTIQEIELALKMNLLGDYDETIEHYNQFNIRFLSAVIRAYKRKRADADRKMFDIQRLISKPAPKVYTADEIEQIKIQSVITKYTEYLSGQEDLLFGLATDYDFLLSLGMVNVGYEQLQVLIYQEINVLIAEAKSNINSLNAVATELRVQNRESFQALAMICAKQKLMLGYYASQKEFDVTPEELKENIILATQRKDVL